LELERQLFKYNYDSYYLVNQYFGFVQNLKDVPPSKDLFHERRKNIDVGDSGGENVEKCVTP
jgi:hypothetical protein